MQSRDPQSSDDGQSRRTDGQKSPIGSLLRAIVSGDEQKSSRLLDASPNLALQVAEVGATRQASTVYYFDEIAHYMYAGDTALHIAAAAYQRAIAKSLLARGADIRARNRRGAEPLHYSVDGNPGSATWNPAAQEATVECLLEAGADPNSSDKSGVAPLHRAVRTRCAAAVRALLAGGANARRKNGSGSTPLHLAVRNTGRGGTGSLVSQEQQREIILLLLQHGARPTDRDTSGRSVRECAAGEWVLEVLRSS